MSRHRGTVASSGRAQSAAHAPGTIRGKPRWSMDGSIRQLTKTAGTHHVAFAA
jgi:hypothetical protein